MGWTSYHATFYKNGKIDRKREMDERLTQKEHDGYPEFTILKSAMVGSVYYAAIRRRNKGEKERVFAIVCLTRTKTNDYFNFYYKDMDENMGPYEYKCPKGILALLSPTENEWALEWRKRCEEYHSKRKEKDWLQSLPIGGKVIYTNYGEEIELVKHAPMYQFKTWFWYCPEKNQYIPKKRVNVNNAREVTV